MYIIIYLILFKKYRPQNLQKAKNKITSKQSEIGNKC